MFTGTLDEKTWVDLEAFLAQDLSEGLRLDYKRSVPNNLEKTIAAMANTEGGLILIGVDEDPDRPRHPIFPPTGIPTDQAVERIMSKAYQAIHEPLYPQVHAIQFPDDPARCVLVIRIEPSERAPHAIGVDQNQIYVRVDSQSMPNRDEESPMRLDRIEWLLRRRERGLKHLGKAEERAREVLGYATTTDPVAFVTVRPTLPHATPLTIGQLRIQAAIPAHAGGASFPDGMLRSVSGGLVSRIPPRLTYVDVTGLSSYSMTLPPRSLASDEEARIHVIGPSWVAATMAMFKWTARSLSNVGWGGSLVGSVELSGVRDISLRVGNHWLFEPERHQSLQDHVRAEVVRTTEQMLGDPVDAAAALLHGISHAFAYEFDEGDLAAFIRQQLGA